ncbi:MAG: hypothetical protein OXL98_09225 [Acidimicrobiaceae bacterium]|nr:hypothetical protein [Acidimicrobiaceae bacterium]
MEDPDGGAFDDVVARSRFGPDICIQARGSNFETTAVWPITCIHRWSPPTLWLRTPTSTIAITDPEKRDQVIAHRWGNSTAIVSRRDVRAPD